MNTTDWTRSRRLQHQLPAYSPLALRHLASALAMGGGEGIEDVLRRAYFADDVLLCGSGTQALQTALVEATRRTGSRTVALPAFGCYDLASAAVGAGVGVCLYDVDPATLAPDLDSLRRAVSEGARTIVAAPLFGIPLPWDTLADLARAEGCLLIEDAAQGHGAAWHDRPLGSWGELSVVSFGRGKGWTAGGGGALFARGNDRTLSSLPHAPATAAPRAAVSSFAQWALGRPAVYAIPAGIPALGLGRTVYHEPRAPHALSRFSRTLLAATRAAADAEAAHRRRTAEVLNRAAREAGLDTYQPPPGSTAGYLRFPLRLNSGARALADTAAARRLGIAGAYPVPLSRLPQLAPLMTHAGHFPGAAELVRGLVTLPTHSQLTAAAIDRLAGFIAAASAAGKRMARTRD